MIERTAGLENARLPFCLIHAGSHAGAGPGCGQTLISRRMLRIETEGILPSPYVLQDGSTTVVVFGKPVVGGRIDPAACARMLSRSDSEQTLSSFNGSFLVLRLQEDAQGQDRCLLANDRFASIPLFYSCSGPDFQASFNYLDLARQTGRKEADPESLAQLIWLKQLLSDRTYSSSIMYLKPATCVRIGRSGVEFLRYWNPRYSSRRCTLDAFTADFVARLKQSLERVCSLDQRYGLFLSGGLDSRLILAACRKPLTCFTINDWQNTETMIAREAAGRAGVDFVFLKRDIDFYHATVERATLAGSGMHCYVDAHFMGYGRRIAQKADYMLHGCFMDSLFQGSYLPKKIVRIFGKPTSFYRLAKMEKDMCAMFLASVKYRIKSMAALSIFSPDRRGKLYESLHSCVEDVLSEGKRFCSDPYQLWEYLCFHYLSRYWSFINVLSMRTEFVEATPAIDNDLYELYLSMPVEFKMYGRVPKRALAMLSRPLSGLINANSGNRIINSPLRDTCATYAKKIVNRMRGATASRAVGNDPIFTERSWLNYGEYLRRVTPMKIMVQELADSKYLSGCGIFDMDEVAAVVSRHMEGRSDHSDVILRLLSAQQLLSSLERSWPGGR